MACLWLVLWANVKKEFIGRTNAGIQWGVSILYLLYFLYGLYFGTSKGSALMWWFYLLIITGLHTAINLLWFSVKVLQRIRR
ncbi:MAG: hypothetical protein JNL57_12540 [Bacteroidetes bacterium]|nr:hypothetical protein [Bacteroidota bacterium]